MKTRAGLTLVEVLAALVILTLVATSSLPLLRDAARIAHEPAPHLDLSDLGELADSLVSDPGRYGVASLTEGGTLSVRAKDGKAVTFGTMQDRSDAMEGKVSRQWIFVRSGERLVLRWHIPSEDDSEEAGK